jgi:hypothetical protein
MPRSECNTELALLRNMTYTLSGNKLHNGCVDSKGSAIGVQFDSFTDDLQDIGHSSGLEICPNSLEEDYTGRHVQIRKAGCDIFTI